MILLKNEFEYFAMNSEDNKNFRYQQIKIV